MAIDNRINVPWDELEVGQLFRSPGRTVTETDVINFCMLTGNWIEIHSNVNYASKTRWGKRIVQGQLTFSLISGLLQFGPAIQANYGVDNLRFLHPVLRIRSSLPRRPHTERSPMPVSPRSRSMPCSLAASPGPINVRNGATSSSRICICR